MRHLIGLVIALVCSLAGTLLLWFAGGNAVMQLASYLGGGGPGVYSLLAGVACLLLAAAAVSVRWSPLGVIVAGGVHIVFSLLGVLVPYTFTGVQAPTIVLLNSLFELDRGIATGGVYFVAFGTGLLIGFALLAVGIMARRARPSLLWRVLSAVGGLFAIGAVAWVLAAGGDFYRNTFQILRWDGLLAALMVVGAIVVGALLLPAGRSSIGAWISGGVLSLVGIVLLVADPSAYIGLAPELRQALPLMGWSGMILAVGMTMLGLALGILLRPEATQPPPQVQPQPHPQPTLD